jgi:DTW domain-containing protein YfiP
MSKRRETIERRCPKCSINKAMCFCDSLTKVETLNRVSLIFHVKEYFLTSNTGKIANLVLSNSTSAIRGLKDEPISEDYTLGGKYTPYYLYPSEDAIFLDDTFLKAQTKPINLIVPDATWRQSKKFHKREPVLKGIPHLKLNGQYESMYELRKQKFSEGVCTIEAIAYALIGLNEKSSGEELLRILKIMNDKVMETRTHQGH